VRIAAAPDDEGAYFPLSLSPDRRKTEKPSAPSVSLW
jgi:hypothetical protein